MTQNPLARSRLDDAFKFIDEEEYVNLSVGSNHWHTIRAALDHLLNPRVSDEIIELYINDLTKEDTK